MALQVLTLEAALLRLGDRSAGDGPASGAPERLVSAYETYTRDATDAGGNRLATANPAAARAALAPTFASTNNPPSVGAQALAAAYTAYWLGAVFVPGTPPPPGTPGVVGGNGIMGAVLSSAVVTPPPGGPDLAAHLLALFSLPTLDAHGRARAMAEVLHAATLQVQVTLVGTDTTPPPTGPLPATLVAPLR